MATCHLPNPGLLLLLVVTFAHNAGCARSVATIDSARKAFAMGDLKEAADMLHAVATESAKMTDAAELDMAVVELASGNAAAAESRLRILRDRFDTTPGLSPLHEAAAILTDDTARIFRPAGYEEVMIRTMLAVCSLAGDQIDAESYTLQAINHQAKLAAQAEKNFLNHSDIYQPIAVAPYLRGVLREATHHDYDDATRSYQLVSSVRPQFAAAQADIARSSGGAHSAPGHGVLYVISCVGRGPILQEIVAPTTTAALAIASTVLNSATNQTNDDTDGPDRSDDDDEPIALPNIASVKVPEVVIPNSPLATVGVLVNGAAIGTTETLTDVGELAILQNTAEMPWTIARAVIRRVTKEAAVATVGDSLGLEGTAGSLFHFAAASAWSGTEKADTRCWGLLPREIQVLRAELPAGIHQIHLMPLGYGGNPLATGVVNTVTITDGRNQYLIVVAPTEQMHVVTSDQTPTNSGTVTDSGTVTSTTAPTLSTTPVAFSIAN